MKALIISILFSLIGVLANAETATDLRSKKTNAFKSHISNFQSRASILNRYGENLVELYLCIDARDLGSDLIHFFEQYGTLSANFNPLSFAIFGVDVTDKSLTDLDRKTLVDIKMSIEGLYASTISLLTEGYECKTRSINRELIRAQCDSISKELTKLQQFAEKL